MFEFFVPLYGSCTTRVLKMVYFRSTCIKTSQFYCAVVVTDVSTQGSKLVFVNPSALVCK